MWELDHKEGWALKNRCFELWCWRRLLRVPWTARRSNQSILKEISPGCSLEGLMLKLKLQNFGLHTWYEELTHLKRPWCWERLRVGGEGEDRGWDGWMASLMPWTWVWVSSGSWWWTGRPGVLQSMGSQRVGHDLATKLNWSPRLAIPEDICKINGLFTLLPHLTTSLFYKRTWRSDPTRWLFWHINLPSSWSASFPNKIVFFASILHLWFIGMTELGVTVWGRAQGPVFFLIP